MRIICLFFAHKFFKLFFNRTNQECFEEAFLPTLQTLASAPASSPLAEVDITNVAELFVDLTRPSGLNPQAKNSQDYQVGEEVSLWIVRIMPVMEVTVFDEIILFIGSLTQREATF